MPNRDLVSGQVSCNQVTGEIRVSVMNPRVVIQMY